MLRPGPWRVRLAEPSLRAELEPALAALRRGEEPPAAERVKHSRRREVLRLALAGGEAVYWKRDLDAGWRWRRPGVVREYANLVRARTAGFAAVEPLALAERGGREAVLVTRALSGAQPLTLALRGASLEQRAALLREAAGLARRLHEARLWHRDLHPGNLLVRGDQLWLVDLQKLQTLPFLPPLALRASDLVLLASAASAHAIAEAYAGAAPGGPDPERLAAALARAAARFSRTRLRSRERRCVVPSTGFRSERRGALRVLRRADVTTSAALAVAEAAAPGEQKRVAAFAGGPPPGLAPDANARGQGAAEPGAPATAPAWARGFGSGPGLRTPVSLCHEGMRAWRNAHALLLRGIETPAPLALVEQRRFGWVLRSVLLTRCAEDAPPLAVAVAGEPERARAAGAQLAAWHAQGVEAAALGLAFAPASLRLIALEPERARFATSLDAHRAEQDLARIAQRLGPGERDALLAGYRAAASA